ncbi:M17 family metallopeptidase [Bacteroidota bacterium]
MTTIKLQSKTTTTSTNQVILLSDIKNIPKDVLNTQELKYAKQEIKNKNEIIAFNRFSNWLFIHVIKKEKIYSKRIENCRKAGDSLLSLINKKKIKQIYISSPEDLSSEVLALAEGMALGNYQFIKYFTDKKEKKNSLSEIYIKSKSLKQKEIDDLNIVIEATYFTRTLVNEPVAYLNSMKLAEEIENLFKETEAKVEVLNKKKIEALKMGGLLAVNKGSIDPPTFSIIEWKPKNAKNKKPIVFVGKGIVYDTGGLNIKTGNFMNDMKCDMAGAAMMIGSVYAIAKAKIPVHIIALIPSTDNRLNGNAYASGDVITMYDGTTVEVLNTDAEGRMILADALAYAKKYNPEVVIDSATLTGAAMRAIGKYGIVAMQNKASKYMELLKESGENVYERLAEFPFWDEYGELIKSEIADIKNLGGIDAGMITAGKFLAHFTDYPFIHLDIAGPAHIDKKSSYITGGGTGIGVRLLFDYIKNKV